MDEVAIELLTKAHDRASFDCGESRQNEFLKLRARKHADMKFSQTWVAVRKGDKQILGFITLSMGSIQFDRISEEITLKLPRYPIPVLHVGQLATDLKAQGKGVGSLRLAFASQKAIELSQTVGCYAIELYAQDRSAYDYYLRRGFLPLKQDGFGLFAPIKTLQSGLS